MKDLKEALNIRYLKLYFTVVISNKCTLPRYKVSTLRGGMGEMLLRNNCISNRNCDICSFSKECIVQHILYSQYAIQPVFASNGDSVGYVFECHNSKESFIPGDELKFAIVLFGNTIVHVRQIINAFHMLGKSGIGKDAARYDISEIMDSKGVAIYKDKRIAATQIKPSYVYEYAINQIERLQNNPKLMITMQSPTTIKFRGQFLQEFNMEAFIRAVKRRIYMLDCFEGIDAISYYQKEIYPTDKLLLYQEYSVIGIPRYSNRKGEKMILRGIIGKMEIEMPNLETLILLASGELMHVGKNTSFGFGLYKINES